MHALCWHQNGTKRDRCIYHCWFSFEGDFTWRFLIREVPEIKEITLFSQKAFEVTIPKGGGVLKCAFLTLMELHTIRLQLQPCDRQRYFTTEILFWEDWSSGCDPRDTVAFTQMEAIHKLQHRLT